MTIELDYSADFHDDGSVTDHATGVILIPADEPFCELCDGPLVELGSLGRLTHYRCRNCGFDQSVTAR